jgi:hypothetical protein
MTAPQMERHVYQQDEPELFEQIENLVFASVFEIEVDGYAISLREVTMTRWVFFTS